MRGCSQWGSRLILISQWDKGSRKQAPETWSGWTKESPHHTQASSPRRRQGISSSGCALLFWVHRLFPRSHLLENYSDPLESDRRKCSVHSPRGRALGQWAQAASAELCQLPSVNPSSQRIRTSWSCAVVRVTTEILALLKTWVWLNQLGVSQHDVCVLTLPCPFEFWLTDAVNSGSEGRYKEVGGSLGCWLDGMQSLLFSQLYQAPQIPGSLQGLWFYRFEKGHREQSTQKQNKDPRCAFTAGTQDSFSDWTYIQLLADCQSPAGYYKSLHGNIL